MGETEVSASKEAKGRLRGGAALRLHFALLFGLALCAAAFKFELSRAIGGNSLSWAYVGEWPFFAGFGVYFWWFIFSGKERRPRKGHVATVAPEFANMAAQWQAHQRELLESQQGAGGDGGAEASAASSKSDSAAAPPEAVS